jgi:signal transduction histidine kinase/ligand-binding sensor domain-containing protein
VNKQRTAVIALGILLACCPRVSALNPALDISQYAHTPWKAGEGLSKGIIFSIAQTPDGYLWLGTEYGLLRFDGVRSVPWQPPAGQHLPNSEIRSLLAARDGNLWIGTRYGLASWKDGKLTQYSELAGQLINTIFEDREGTIWTGGWAISIGRICAIQSGSARCHGEDGRLGHGVYSLYEDSAGNLWLGATTGLWRWKPGPPKLYPMPDAASGINSLIEGDNGALLIARRKGIQRLVEQKSEAYPLPDVGRQFTPYRMLRDRSGGLWIGTQDRGLLHVHQGRTDRFGRLDGLTADFVESLLEDREGNIWVATTDGLDLFRDYAVSTISGRQGLPEGAAAVLAAKDGSVWVGSAQGLASLNNGQVRIYPLPGARAASVGALPNLQSITQDNLGRIWVFTEHEVAYLANDRFIPVIPRPGGVVYSSAADDAGSLWASDQNQGLIRLRGESGVERIPWARLGVRDVATALFPDPVQGGLWLGFLGGGVAYFKEGQVRASYAGAEGLGAGRVSGLQLDGDGTLWAATEGGLSRIRNGRVATLTSRNGLPCDAVKWVVEGDAGSFWLYTACGLVRIARSELDGWVSDPGRTVQTTVFDVSDGVRSHAFTNGTTPRVAKAVDGRLWFLPLGGVSVVDPPRLPFNKIPPPVHIEEITANGKAYEVTRGLRLPPRVRNLEIRYTALSLAVPEKVRFRFKLEGQDSDWREVVNRRRVEYSNLPPGDFRFRVMASNNSGVWNEEGASLDFAIAPAYYQTMWFEALIAVAGLALLWAAYLYRVRRIAHEFDLRLDERVNERTRVARELHDTLLQTFHGVLFRFQAAANMLPERPAEAKQNFERAIDLAAQAITEGRDAIQDLRASTVVTNDLAVAITTLGDELAASDANASGAVVHVAVQGSSRDLHPILRDDIYRIAGEALRNAFRHAHARRIEVEITYDDRQFRLQVRDDGRGIEPAVLADDRRGHFGLPGIRERAELVGGHLDLWSEVGVGTEIDLTIPAAKAYATAGARRRAWWFTQRTGTDA